MVGKVIFFITAFHMNMKDNILVNPQDLISSSHHD